MSMSDNLERLTKAVEKLTDNGGGSVEMSPEDFIAYAAGQIEKMSSDTPEVKTRRVAALKANVEAITKNFEGPTAIPLTGLLSVIQFADPDQVQTTIKTIEPMGVGGGPDNFSINGEQAAVNGAGAAPTGQLVPAPMAAGSGFESPAMETFAKALEGLTKALIGIADETPSSEGETGSQTVGTSEGDPKPVKKNDGSEKASVAKVALWPIDMNTPFGRGETDDDDDPEWGRDGSEVPDDAAPASDGN
jgi:hypothetical protein